MADERIIDFIIPGVQKGGTTPLAHFLGQHPDVVIGEGEPHFFDRHFDRGPAWYRRETGMAAHPDKCVGEKTPSLICLPETHARMRATCPDVRLVLLLRDPVRRAYSHWNMQVRNGNRHVHRDGRVVPFSEKIREDVARRDGRAAGEPLDISSCVARGFYMHQIDDLLRHFPREQLLVLVSEHLRDPESFRRTCRLTTDFLGVAPFEVAFEEYRARPYRDPLPADDEAWLREVYAEPNRRLFDFLGFEPEEWSATPRRE